MTLNDKNKIFFIGIGGIGMSAIARMLLLQGKKVSGSDLASSVITEELTKFGAEIEIGEPRADAVEGFDLVIYTVAIPEGHPQLVTAKKAGIPCITYPQALGQVAKDKFVIAVAGTHGKTTTTAMIAQILIEAGLDPTVIVGSLLTNSADEKRSNFISGKSKYLVVEACEYKRSFLNLEPDIAVITNIDDDHLDYYGTFAGVQQGFAEFVGQIKSGGTFVTDAGNPKVSPAISNFKGNVSDYQKLDQKVGGKFSLKIPGAHNIENAKAALAVASILGIPVEVALKALANFSGTWRRFESRGETSAGALVYDDYGHHPTEIKATLQAAREKFPNQKIVAVFQPHLYSRTKEHFAEFAGVFAEADEVLVLPIYAAREPQDLSISSEMIVEDLQKVETAALFVANFDIAAEYLKKNLKKGDIVLTIGAGSVNKLADMLVA